MQNQPYRLMVHKKCSDIGCVGLNRISFYGYHICTSALQVCHVYIVDLRIQSWPSQYISGSFSDKELMGKGGSYEIIHHESSGGHRSVFQVPSLMKNLRAIVKGMFLSVTKARR